MCAREAQTAAFRSINQPLRQAAVGWRHPLPVTVYFLQDAIKKLRLVMIRLKGNAADVGRAYWRGMKDLAVDDTFMLQGGTEMAPMSCSTDLQVAMEYAVNTSPCRPP